MKPVFTVCAVFVVCACMAMSSCSKDSYTASMAASDDVSNVVGDAIAVVSQLQTDHLITQAETADIAGYLGNVTTLNQSFRSNVKTIHLNPSAAKTEYLTAAQVFVTAASTQANLKAVHVNNPAAQIKVQSVLTAISTALNGIQTAINAAKGK